MKTYKVAEMDTVIRIVTILVCLLAGFFLKWGIEHPARWGLLVAAAFLLLLIWMCWRIAPKRYDLTDDALVIVRGWPFRDISIPIAEIHEVRPVKISAFTTLRTFGVGGLFSASGWFWNKEIGSFFGEFTSIGRTVLIDSGKKYVISPEDADGFVSDMEQAIPSMKRV